jgi:hypothetical protein
MVSLTTGNAMYTALVYACGKPIAVTCLIQILVLQKFHLQLFDRFVCFYILITVAGNPFLFLIIWNAP